MENLNDLNRLIQTKNKLNERIKKLPNLSYYNNRSDNGIYISQYDVNFNDIEKEYPGLTEKALAAFREVFELSFLHAVKKCESEISKYEVIKS